MEGGMLPSIHRGKDRGQISQSFDSKSMMSDKPSKMLKNGKSGFAMMSRDFEAETKGKEDIQELDGELALLRQENAQMRYQRELMNREFETMMYENNGLYSKLANLEKVFIGESITSEMGENGDVSDSDGSSSSKRYSHSLLVSENNELRARIENVEQEKIDLKGTLIQLEGEHTPSTRSTREESNDYDPQNVRNALHIKQVKSDLEEQIQLAQSRVNQITEKLLDSYPKPSSSSSKKSSSSSYMRFKKSMNK
mmetsp:Transcript_23870/g.23789  ORF Transcript_23870/g.23789 Transcript_23870/m.23789 type:complete len:253 (-) Transcript_23870:7-765(-)